MGALLDGEPACGGAFPAVPVGGPACVVAGERRAVPAASAADISALFIKSMTTLSSPISGPSCTGVLLLLSGRVSSILLPCYSLELLMANTIPPFSAWPLPPRSRWNQAWRGGELGDRSGVGVEEVEEEDFPRECLFLTGDRADCLDTRVRYMGPCNEKTLTGPACSVMKVLQSCEWIRTSFMLLSLCLSHKLPISSILTVVVVVVVGAKDAS